MKDKVWIEHRNSKNGRRWYVFVETPEMDRPKSFGAGLMYATALDLKKQKIAELVANRNGFLTKKDSSLKRAKDEYMCGYAKKHPKSSRRAEWGIGKVLKYFGEDKLVGTVLQTDFPKFKNDLLKKDHNQNGLINILKFASAFFNYCVQAGYAQANPVKGSFEDLEETQVARFLTQGEINIVLQHCTSRKQNDGVLEDLVKTALFTGMRQSEVVNIRRSWIDADFQRIIIPAEFCKTRRSRAVPIHEHLLPILKKYLGFTDLIFEGWDAGRLRQAFHRGIKRAKIGRVRFHDLRHTFASQYLRDGGTIADLRLILGHRSILTTQRYAHFQQDHLDERINKVTYDFMAPKLALVI